MNSLNGIFYKNSNKIALIFLFMTIAFFSHSEEINIEDDSSNEKCGKYFEHSITTEANKKFGLKKIKQIILKAVNKKGIILGGLIAYDFYGTLQIDVLWIEENHRSKGIGKLLLEKAEQIAKEKSLNQINVSTMECWNAVNFYKKFGFKVEFIRDGFDNKLKQYFLTKKIK
jgi:GNAT superfamily N-acetyltransferase